MWGEAVGAGLVSFAIGLILLGAAATVSSGTGFAASLVIGITLLMDFLPSPYRGDAQNGASDESTAPRCCASRKPGLSRASVLISNNRSPPLKTLTSELGSSKSALRTATPREAKSASSLGFGSWPQPDRLAFRARARRRVGRGGLMPP